eukprot:TRINITY_DN12341_c3_g2_i1.p1 TRINITY_DN12341_c3_g2~~TRINITY_DN12341_c3_g2_i1.p1  ORF type:complete len:800 (+),score=140.64 TRINITY_DN12341_c3_g2_i1:106-2505(+)
MTMNAIYWCVLLATLLWKTASQPMKVPISPAECGNDDCYRAFAFAIRACKSNSNDGCLIELLPSTIYRIVCPLANRTSSAQTEDPAIALNSMHSITISGNCSHRDAGCSRPILSIDYVYEGCAGIGILNASDIVVKDLVIDAHRLPYTTGSIAQDTAPDGINITMALEDDNYAWDTSSYPWLTKVYVAQAIPQSGRAVRSLPDIDMVEGLVRTFYSPSNRHLTLTYNSSSAIRANLTKGTRIFLKHYANMQAWGVYGFNVTNLTVDNVALWSIAGMGYRCDFCHGNYTLRNSQIQQKPLTNRPMSITADGIHFMHHQGAINVQGCDIQWQGDDAFNLHGNFVLIDRFVTPTIAQYVDESGPGWITAAPTYMVGDTVRFYSRRTLRKLTPTDNRIVAANATHVEFAHPEVAVARYDMFLSLSRVSSARLVDTTFANSNSRGALISGVDVEVHNMRFANLSKTALLVYDGGCGATGGDFTEGPFTQNMVVTNNTFADVSQDPKLNTWTPNKGVVQISGCVPLPLCGIGGSIPSSYAKAQALPADQANISRTATMVVAGDFNLTFLGYQAQDDALRNVQIALYTMVKDAFGRPSAELAMLSIQHPHPDDEGWVWLELPEPITLPAGEYVIVHRYASGTWRTSTSWLRDGGCWTLPSTALPLFFPNQSGWIKASAAVPLAARWQPVGSWCDPAGTQPPTIVAHPGDNETGRVSDEGRYAAGGILFHNVTMADNQFSSSSRQVPYLHLGSIANLTIANNTFTTDGPMMAMHEGLIYNSPDFKMLRNRCLHNGTDATCAFDVPPE